jgi:hypothetical protein
MKPLLAILAAVLLLAGCGHSAPNRDQSRTSRDPFVGTWQMHGSGSGPGDGIVISKALNAYHFAWVDHYKVVRGSSMLPYARVFFRHGSNELKAVLKRKDPSLPGNGVQLLETLDLNPTTGRLALYMGYVGGDAGAPLEFSKVSGGTALPSPWPTKSP